MRLVVTLLVRDEIDVVAATIEHFLDQEAAHLVVTDNGSVDGTREVLAEYVATGRVSVIDEPDHTFRQSHWVTRMARVAATEHGADWVINADADEFWVPQDRTTLAGSLAAVGPEHGLVQARRTDLLGVRGGRGHWSRRLVWRDLLTLSARGTPRLPKVAHRADPGRVETPILYARLLDGTKRHDEAARYLRSLSVRHPHRLVIWEAIAAHAQTTGDATWLVEAARHLARHGPANRPSADWGAVDAALSSRDLAAARRAVT